MGTTLTVKDRGQICCEKMLGLQKYWASDIRLTPLGTPLG